MGVYMLEFHLLTFGFLFIFPHAVLVVWNPTEAQTSILMPQLWRLCHGVFSDLGSEALGHCTKTLSSGLSAAKPSP